MLYNTLLAIAWISQQYASHQKTEQILCRQNVHEWINVLLNKINRFNLITAGPIQRIQPINKQTVATKQIK